MAGDVRYINDGLRMIPEDHFFDRDKEIEILLKRFIRLPDHPAQSCALVGPRLAGSSEIAKRIFRELFINQEDILPFYYHFERTFNDPTAFVRDYLATLIRQYIAFLDKDTSYLLPAVLSFQAVEKIAKERSDPELDKLLRDYEDGLHDPDKENLVRIALHAPLMLAESSAGSAFIILDHLHLIYQMDWAPCTSLSELYPSVMGYGQAPHLITGQKNLLIRKFLGQESMVGLVRRLDLPGLTEEKSLELFTGLCQIYHVPVDKDAVQKELSRFHGIPFYMTSLIRMAEEENVPLTSSEAIRDLYFKEISRGEIAFYYNALLNRCFGDPFAKRDAIRILSLSPLNSGEMLRIEEVARKVNLDLKRVRELTDALVLAGLLNEQYGMLFGVQDPVLADFLRVSQRFWLGKTDMETVRKELFKGFPEVPILTELMSTVKSDAGEESDKISFGLVLPMVSETELVAARALEQVAERVDFPDDEIGKIRMALIEACINSFEHSGSRNGKIYITFTLDKEKLTIVVEDKGVSFDPARVPVPDREKSSVSADRRGWGIELIKNLMDEVVFADVPVGTRLKMIKYYPKDAGWKAQAV
jgi:anti-sigma regulatory factor (Ser/Thr protein kinase)